MGIEEEAARIARSADQAQAATNNAQVANNGALMVATYRKALIECGFPEDHANYLAAQCSELYWTKAFDLDQCGCGPNG